MTEQQRTRDEIETLSDADRQEVKEVTHATSYGRGAANRVADQIAEKDAKQYLLNERDGRTAAHASIVNGWTEHHDDRPDGVRREVWINPFHDPENPTETGKRLVNTRRIRQRVLGWTGDLP